MVSVDDVVVLIRRQLRGRLRSTEAIGAATELDMLNLSSLDLAEVFFGIEEIVGDAIDPVAVSEVMTVGDIVSAVVGQFENEAPLVLDGQAA